MKFLRAVAVAIAIAAAADPAVTVSGRVRPAIGLIGRHGAVIDELRRTLGHEFAIVDGADPAAAAFVAVGDRYPDEPIPEAALVSTVTVPAGTGVRIASLSTPRAIPAGTMIHVDAEIVATGLRGGTTRLTASVDGVDVARASHEWKDGGPWHAVLDVVPLGVPPFVVTVSADGASATALVDVAERLPVLVYDARPSWTTTFVRRALENDPRFAVSGMDLASRSVAVRTNDAPRTLQSADLDRYRVVIVGGLDRLSATDLAALNRFMIERGGAVALLPDTAEVGRVFHDAPAKEALLERATPLTTQTPLPRIDASELLRVPLPQDARLLAGDVIWTAPRGEGQLLFSGAMDAWRFRGPSFDRFWQSAISGLALAVRPPLSVDVTPGAIPFGESARVHVRLRGADPSQPMTVTATLSSGGVVRAWPDPAIGSFSALVTPSRRGVDRIDVVAVNGSRTERASARIVAGDHRRPVSDPIVPLALLSASHGGIDVGPNDAAKIDRWLRTAVETKTRPMRAHPMRSPWWMVPFAGCLCAEWWMRRRRGLR